MRNRIPLVKVIGIVTFFVTVQANAGEKHSQLSPIGCANGLSEMDTVGASMALAREWMTLKAAAARSTGVLSTVAPFSNFGNALNESRTVMGIPEDVVMVDATAQAFRHYAATGIDNIIATSRLRAGPRNFHYGGTNNYRIDYPNLSGIFVAPLDAREGDVTIERQGGHKADFVEFRFKPGTGLVRVLDNVYLVPGHPETQGWIVDAWETHRKSLPDPAPSLEWAKANPEAYSNLGVARDREQRKMLADLARQGGPRRASEISIEILAYRRNGVITEVKARSQTLLWWLGAVGIAKASRATEIEKLSTALHAERARTTDLIGLTRAAFAMGPLFDAKAGFANGSLEAHTTLVGDVMEDELSRRDFSELDIPAHVRTKAMMRAMTLLHDVGKAVAVREGDSTENQHAYTEPLMGEIMAQLGFNDDEVTLARALVGHDIVGETIQKKRDSAVAAKALYERALGTVASPAAFLELQSLFTLCDLSAYPRWREEHVVPNRDGKMTHLRPTSTGELFPKYRKLDESPTLDVFADLDNVILHTITGATPALQEGDRVVEAYGVRYVVYGESIAAVERLIANPRVRLTFFSAAPTPRNETVLKALGFFDKVKGRLLSGDAIAGGTAKDLRVPKVRAVVPQLTLARALLVDDDKESRHPQQQGNFVLVPVGRDGLKDLEALVVEKLKRLDEGKSIRQ